MTQEQIIRICKLACDSCVDCINSGDFTKHFTRTEDFISEFSDVDIETAKVVAYNLDSVMEHEVELRIDDYNTQKHIHEK